MKDKIALIAVYDKTGIAEFARGLADLGYKFLSTGRTAETLRAAGIAVKEVAELTRFPEILDGRVKTLHPKIFGGILARPTPGHRRELANYKIPEIDIVVVNLYPFKEVAARRGALQTEVVENIDIGGVALLRAAAKNYERVIVVSSPSQYADVLRRLRTRTDNPEWRRRLAAEAFQLTAKYDVYISAYFSGRGRHKLVLPDEYHLTYYKTSELSYGENPHQRAAFYERGGPAVIKQLAGPPASYNNYLDLAAAIALVNEFDNAACAVLKHNSPCGVAVGRKVADAFRRAWNADSLSAYGGVVAFNRHVDMDCAAAMMEKGTFFLVCVATAFNADALNHLTSAKTWCDRLRIFTFKPNLPKTEIRSVLGGLLVQETDYRPAARDHMVQVAGPAVSAEVVEDLLFAWAVVKHARSNAIVVAKDLTTLAIGAGAVNRLWPAEDAVKRAGGAAQGAVAASDGFFPKPDALETLCRAGVVAVVQPSGSKADDQAIAVARQYNVALFFAERRHFRH